MAYEVTDRRPIAARSLGVFGHATDWLAARGVSPNSISIAGLLLAIAAGICLAATRWVSPDVWWVRLLWLGGVVGVQGRLLCNLLDGMVAVKRQVASATGELFNEVPDRFADVAVLVGLGYAAGGWPVAGWAAAVAAVLTAYIRGVGKGLGRPADFGGPMAKQQRMCLVTVVALVAVIVPGWVSQIDAAGSVLVVIAAGAILTFVLRLRRLAKFLRQTSRDAETPT